MLCLYKLETGERTLTEENPLSYCRDKSMDDFYQINNGYHSLILKTISNNSETTLPKMGNSYISYHFSLCRYSPM